MRSLAACFAWTLALALAGCIKPPDVVVVDRATALEAQAAGEYPELERALRHAGITPKGADFTRGQLTAAGVDTSRTEMDEVLRIYSEVQTDAQLVDALLVRRCIGEASDGLLRETPSTCSGTVDVAEASRAVQRTNRNRRQIWALMRAELKGATDEQVRRAWRQAHLIGVVCGGNVQRDDGSWEVKPC
jgi:hypothetical protein